MLRVVNEEIAMFDVVPGAVTRFLVGGRLMAAGAVALAAAVVPAQSCQLAEADFKRLDIGMNADQVREILKWPAGTVTAGGWAGASSVLWSWTAPGVPMFAMVLFVEGRLLNFSQAGLE